MKNKKNITRLTVAFLVPFLYYGSSFGQSNIIKKPADTAIAKSRTLGKRPGSSQDTTTAVRINTNLPKEQIIPKKVLAQPPRKQE